MVTPGMCLIYQDGGGWEEGALPLVANVAQLTMNKTSSYTRRDQSRTLGRGFDGS